VVPRDIAAPRSGALRAASRHGDLRSRRWERASHRVGVKELAYGACALWAVAFSAAAAFGQSRFLERRYDLGNFAQAVWATAHGHFLQVTEAGGEQVSRLGIHVDPIVALLVPLWWLWPSPTLLLVLQAFALALAAVPLYWLARKHLGSERQAALIVAAYLLSPAVGWNAFHEFHALALAVPLLMFSIWFLDEDRLWAFCVAAGAAVLCQEQIGAIVGCLGLWYAWRRRDARRGLAIAAAGFLVTAIDFGIVMPHFSHGSPYHGRYLAVGGSPGGILHNAIVHPLRVLGAVQLWDLFAILFLLLPVFGICLASSIALCAVPQVALLVLADGTGWDPLAQNVLPLIPFIYVGTVLALERTASQRRLRYAPRHVLFATGLVAMLIAAAGVFGPLHPFDKRVPSSSYLAAERHAVGLVPERASVSTTNHLGAHLAARSRLYVFPILGEADWVVVESRDAWLPPLPWLRTREGLDVGAHDLYWQPRLMRRTVRTLEQSGAWQTVFESHGIAVFKRVRTSSHG
jgi:uncharacterized membrane protein